MAESLHGLRLSRFYNYEQVHYIPAPTGGWNPAANPWELPENQAQLLNNFIVKDGCITARAGINSSEDLASTMSGAYTAGPINMAGAVVGISTGGNHTWMIITRRTTASNVIDPWNVVAANATAGNIGVPDGRVIEIDPLSTGGTSVVATADQTPGPRWIDFDGLLYGISYGASTAPTTYSGPNSAYTARATNLLTCPLVQAGATLPTVLLNAPRGAFDLKGYLSRIWLLGGTDVPGGLTTHEPTTLYYTIPGASGVGTAAADWRDPISGLTNKIRMDNDISDYGVGLAVVPNALVIFRRSSVWILRGTTSASFQLQPLSREIGCVDARSIVETDQGVFFLSTRGLMLTDGTSVRNVSGVMESTLQDATAQYLLGLFNGNASFNPGWATIVRTSQGQLLLSIGTYLAPTGSAVPYFAAMFDVHTGVWSGITAAAYVNTFDVDYGAGGRSGNNYPTAFVSRDNPPYVVTVGNKYITNWEDVQRGASFLYTDNALQGTNGLPGADTVPTSISALGAVGIPYRWTTKIVPTQTATHRKFAIVKRYVVDYVHSCLGVSNPPPQWQVIPIDSSGTQLTTPHNLPPAGYNQANTGGPVVGVSFVSAPSIQRENVDFTAELTNDLAFDLSQPNLSPPGATLSNRSQIYGIAVEFQSTRDAR